MPTASKSPKPLSAADKQFHRQCAAAVLSGLYASYGTEIMTAGKPDRDLAIRTAGRVAFAQADEMVRRESEAS